MRAKERSLGANRRGEHGPKGSEKRARVQEGRAEQKRVRAKMRRGEEQKRAS